MSICLNKERISIGNIWIRNLVKSIKFKKCLHLDLKSFKPFSVNVCSNYTNTYLNSAYYSSRHQHMFAISNSYWKRKLQIQMYPYKQLDISASPHTQTYKYTHIHKQSDK